MSPAAVLLLLGIGSLPAPPAPAPLDTLMDVGSYRLHFLVHRGTRPLTIVMETGGGAALDAWAGMDEMLARSTAATVVTYDRAGFGRSDLGPADLLPPQQIRQLHEALTRLGTPAATILVGHSYGALLALLHAHLYPANVRGLVLVDPMNARFVHATGDFVQSTVPHLTHPASPRDSAVARMVNSFDRLIQDAGDAGLRMPMIVITAGVAWWDRPDIDRAWRSGHEAMAQAQPNRRLVVAAGANHEIPAKRPDTIIDAVRSLLNGA